MIGAAFALVAVIAVATVSAGTVHASGWALGGIINTTGWAPSRIINTAVVVEGSAITVYDLSGEGYLRYFDVVEPAHELEEERDKRRAHALGSELRRAVLAHGAGVHRGHESRHRVC